jgi:hypothetical protein
MLKEMPQSGQGVRMDAQITLEQAVAELRNVYGEKWESGYEDGKDGMTETLVERFKISKHEAAQLVQDLERARTIRWQGGADALPAPESQPMTIPLVGGYWYF